MPPYACENIPCAGMSSRRWTYQQCRHSSNSSFSSMNFHPKGSVLCTLNIPHHLWDMDFPCDANRMYAVNSTYFGGKYLPDPQAFDIIMRPQLIAVSFSRFDPFAHSLSVSGCSRAFCMPAKPSIWGGSGPQFKRLPKQA